jgi:uncharacterized membrane protein YkvA (DUF1232 family)
LTTLILLLCNNTLSLIVGIVSKFATVGEKGSGTMFARLKTLTRSFKQEVAVYRLVARHERTPWLAKILLGVAVGYVAMPFDLIPDAIPVLGQLDDVVIVPGLVWIALRLVPDDVLMQCRATIEERDNRMV